MRCRLLSIFLFTTSLGFGAAPNGWIQVSAPHFTVLTNSSEEQGRRIAGQFEQMRAVFQVRYATLAADPSRPIVVLAIKDDKEFRSLEPLAFLAKDHARVAGFFLRVPDKNYILVSLDANFAHPYSTVYHEYTHLLFSKMAEWMPLWLNEGWAQFYQNTDIHEKYVDMGDLTPDDIPVLRKKRWLIPLNELFKVDHSSPYYQKENQTTIFYEESLALTHYLEQRDFRNKTHVLLDYATLLSHGVDPVSAGTQAFGDLKKLQDALSGYIGQQSFSHFQMPVSSGIDIAAIQETMLTRAQTDLRRADFLAYVGRVADAQTMVEQLLKDDPNNVSALETMGFLELRQTHVDSAKDCYVKAAELDPGSFLAQYYAAALSMGTAGSTDPQIESRLRAAIRLNPSFAPAYDRLAMYLTQQRRGLDEARRFALTAVSLDPGKVNYRLDVAQVLLAMAQGESAVAVLQFAATLAQSSEEAEQVNVALKRAREFVKAQKGKTGPE